MLPFPLREKKTMNPVCLPSRRLVLSSVAIAATAVGLRAVLGAPPELLQPATAPAESGAGHPDPFKGLKVGIASYSFRKLPLAGAVKATQRVGVHYTSIKDFHLPLKSTTDERKAAAQAFRDAGITPLSCGVISIKDEPSARNAFEYARDIAVPTIVCHPEPSTLPLLDKLVKEFGIKIAIHNHGPDKGSIYPTPYDAMKVINQLDERIGLCIDVGHTARAGADPVKAIRELHARLYDVHFKDVSRTDGKNPSVEIEVGRGVLDIRGMLQALLDVKFAGHVGFEHEKDPMDPIPGVAESVGYTKGILSGLSA